MSASQRRLPTVGLRRYGHWVDIGLPFGRSPGKQLSGGVSVKVVKLESFPVRVAYKHVEVSSMIARGGGLGIEDKLARYHEAYLREGAFPPYGDSFAERS